MKKQKIPVFIISGKSPINASGGGYSTYAYNLARILKKLGHPLYILALGDENKEEKTEVGTLILHSARIPFLNVNIYALPGLPFYSLLFIKTILQKIKDGKCKRVVVWGIGPWGLAGAILKLFKRSKILFVDNYFTTVRHEWGGGVRALEITDYGFIPKIKYLAIYLSAVQILAQLEKAIFKFADSVITNYKSTEDIIKKEFGVKQKRFYRARFYVQVYKRKSKEVSQKTNFKTPKKYIFYISRHDPRKGINYLLRAYKILLDRGYSIPLLIGGRGDMFESNRKLAKKLEISSRVKFLGFVNNPKPLMKNCTIFAFSSVEEGAGALTVNEAMEMGIPIVSAACDGIVEDIRDGKDGLLIPMADPEAMAEALAKLIDNPSLAKRLAANAKKKYRKNFSFENMYQDIKKLMFSLESK